PLTQATAESVQRPLLSVPRACFVPNRDLRASISRRNRRGELRKRSGYPKRRARPGFARLEVEQGEALAPHASHKHISPPSQERVASSVGPDAGRPPASTPRAKPLVPIASQASRSC